MDAAAVGTHGLSAQQDMAGMRAQEQQCWPPSATPFRLLPGAPPAAAQGQAAWQQQLDAPAHSCWLRTSWLRTTRLPGQLQPCSPFTTPRAPESRP